MIIKSFDLNKKSFKENFYLLYGENQGYKDQIIKSKFKDKYSECTYSYDENEILNNQESFYNELISKSFFEKEKLIIINRATDKIKDIIEEIIEKNISDLVLVLNSNTLIKKSKLRNLFEKNKHTICVPFYEDNNQTLSAIASLFFREKKISISNQTINLITARSRGDRQNLNNELEKIESFLIDKKKINLEDVIKLTNLAEDSCLSKNKKKTIHILNENNYSLEDCILIIRSMLMKSKRLITLCKKATLTKDIETVLSSFKPPIFWKDKEIVKQQINSWSCENAEKLTYEINEIELLIKKYSASSVNILSDFIIEQATSTSN